MDIKIKPYPIICIILPFMFVSCGGESGPEQRASKADPALEQTVSEAETVQLNKKLDSKQNFETGWPHLNISKAILRNISGSCEIASSGTEIKADVKFWVEK